MKNFEITGSVKENTLKGKKLLLVGCMVASLASVVLSGCSSDSNDIGVLDEGKAAENLGENEWIVNTF